MKLEDLAKWAQADFSKWKRGLRGEAIRPTELGKNGQKEALGRFRQTTHNSGLNFRDILKEKADLGKYTVHLLCDGCCDSWLDNFSIALVCWIKRHVAGI